MLSSDVQAVLSFYALEPPVVQRIEPLANAGGWSGSRLWRVMVDGGMVAEGVGSLWRKTPRPDSNVFTAKDSRPLCLRRWPEEHPTKERLRMIHDVLAIVAGGLPMVACPLKAQDGQTFVEHGGHLWELNNWLPGAADFHARPSRGRLRAAMHCLATFHELAARYEARPGAAQAITDRQRQWAGMRQKGVAEIKRAIGQPLGNMLDDRAVRLLAAADETLQNQAVYEALTRVGNLPLAPAIRDIHHDHVLFTDDEVTGLIDFGALRIDTPLADVARLVGSLVGEDAAERNVAFDAYSEVRPLSTDDRRLIDLMDKAGLVLGALNWLMWLYVERRDMGPAEPIVKRLDELLLRLERRNLH